MQNKGADQLRGNHAADQCLCFRYIQITTLLLPKFKIQATYHIPWAYIPVCVRPGLFAHDGKVTHGGIGADSSQKRKPLKSLHIDKTMVRKIDFDQILYVH